MFGDRVTEKRPRQSIIYRTIGTMYNISLQSVTNVQSEHMGHLF